MSLTIYSLGEACERLEELTGRSYTRQRLSVLIRAGRLGCHRIGRFVIVTETDIRNFAEAPKLRPGRKTIDK